MLPAMLRPNALPAVTDTKSLFVIGRSETDHSVADPLEFARRTVAHPLSLLSESSPPMGRSAQPARKNADKIANPAAIRPRFAANPLTEKARGIFHV